MLVPGDEMIGYFPCLFYTFLHSLNFLKNTYVTSIVREGFFCKPQNRQKLNKEKASTTKRAVQRATRASAGQGHSAPADAADRRRGHREHALHPHHPAATVPAQVPFSLSPKVISTHHGETLRVSLFLVFLA